jgi:hypothetical protein
VLLQDSAPCELLSQADVQEFIVKARRMSIEVEMKCFSKSIPTTTERYRATPLKI